MTSLCPDCNGICHTEPHAADSNEAFWSCSHCDKYVLPDGQSASTDHLRHASRSQPSFESTIVVSAIAGRSRPQTYEELYGPLNKSSLQSKSGHWRPPVAVLMFMLLLVGSAGAIAARHSIVHAAPVTARLYAGIGLPVNLLGLDLRQVVSKISGEEAQHILLVEGDIVNLTDQTMKLPKLHITIREADSRPLYHWDAPPPRPSIDKGESLHFRARLAAPPAEGQDVVVRFGAPQTQTQVSLR